MVAHLFVRSHRMWFEKRCVFTAGNIDLALGSC